MIALIAHDKKKLDLALFVRQHRDFFQQVRTVATYSTGQILREKVGIDVEQVAHGPDGGDLMIGGRIAMGQIDAVIFFRDPLTAQPHEPDVSALLRVCDVHNVPLATNLGTAEAIVDWLKEQMEEGEEYEDV
ncbi:MAG: methylglyoxal synthase [Chloroflexota bacterium]|nr:methylglyoxal synthase [Chloroflexota bacterium]